MIRPGTLEQGDDSVSSDSVDSTETGPVSNLESPEKRLDVRLWPAVVILVAEGCALFIPGLVVPGHSIVFMAVFFGPTLGTLAFLIWWLSASRAPWKVRGIVFAGFLAMCIATGFAMDKSMAMPLVIYAIPLATAAWAIVLHFSRGLVWFARTMYVLLGILAVLSMIQPFRLEGADGSLRLNLVMRWQPRQEDTALEALREYQESSSQAAIPDVDAIPEPSASDWAEFRGPERSGKVFGVQIETDWSTKPLVELWRRPVGPGWASFTVVGARAYTQEQRGDDEAVVCYDTATGQEIWAHTDRTKFDEAMGGVGPRATPTVVGDKVYALGANGTLNCLQMASGDLIWSADIVADTGAKLPMWGFASSPLVVGDLVVVYAGAPDAGLIAYDRELGEKAWACPAGSHSYSSPHLARLDGVDLILMMSNAGLAAADVASGSLVWDYDWSSEDQARIVQPAVLPDGDILVATGYGIGTHRIAPRQEAGNWQVETAWETRNLKPYFNDFVLHKGHVYGFDDKIMACVDPATGDRVWKGGRYGYGQLVLLADQDVLLVLSERGDVALVEAKLDGHQELARFHAMDGKAWSHPVVAHGKLFVRNSAEAVCYQLSLVASDDNPVADPLPEE